MSTVGLVPVRVRVTQRDIDRGICTDPYRCAVARAIKRLLRPGCSCLVGAAEVQFFDEFLERRGEFKLPTRARTFVEAFDCGSSRGPIRFRFVVPWSIARRIGGKAVKS